MIKSDKIACVTDLHIGLHQNNTLWHKVSLNFAKWFKKHLDDNGIKDVVICGDVNDNRNEIDVATINVLGQIFSLWKDYNITILVGNHDAYYKDRSDVNSLALFSGWDNITIVDTPTTIDINGKHIGFCPWGVDYKDIPECDYLFGHFEINGFAHTKVRACLDGIECANILEKSKFIVSGHFHIREERKFRQGRVIYAGSPYEQNWGDCETETRGFYFMDLSTGEYNFIENNISPKHKKVRISEILSLGKISDDIKKDFKGNFVTLIVDQDLKTDAVEKMLTILGSLGAISVRPDYIFDNALNIDEDAALIDNIDTKETISEFIDLLQNMEHKEDVKTRTMELYDRNIKEK